MRRTKMVCTLGPSSNTPEKIRALLLSGMDVVRLNCSHGTQEQHTKTFQTVRALAAELHRNVAIMMDLQGPKIRTGKLKDGAPVPLVEGAELCITTRNVPGDANCVSTTYPSLPNDVAPNDRILLADGTMELAVKSVIGEDVTCQVIRGGMLGEHKGINLPGVNVSAPSLTEKDIHDLELAVRLGADYVALSFVRSESDIRTIRSHIDRILRETAEERKKTKSSSQRPGVIAKIERPEALAAFDKILPLVDAVMVARGDLGIEVDLDDIPQIQKSLIAKCNERGTPVITATQMLESMMTNARPTRAEVSDVANAIYDGTDAVMLSGETAAGKFPIEAAQFMADIAAKADQSIAAQAECTGAACRRDSDARVAHSNAIGEAVCRMTQALPISRIVCFTQSGYTARAIARYRPHIPLTAITISEQTLRKCALVWGVDGLQALEIVGIEEMVRTVDELVLTNSLAHPGETIIILAGTPFAVGGVTNLLHLHVVGEPS